MKLGLIAPLMLIVSIVSASCAGAKPLPPNVPQDIATVLACVIPLLAEGVVDPAKLETACAPGEEQLIIDVLALLGQSKTLNPLVVTQARVAYVLGVRAYLKKHSSTLLEAP